MVVPPVWMAVLALGRGLSARPMAAPSYSPDVQARGGDKQYRGEKLPEAQGIRPEYQESGKWIAQPGT